MRPVPLRAQLVVVLICVQVYAVGVGLSYWMQSRAQSRLRESFRRDLGALAELPRLRDDLRRLDDLGNQYLVTGNEAALDERADVLNDMKMTSYRLSAQLS
ncbi:MAG: hypothetical protein KGI84_09985, partial [Elusimicrobia bacterium]|nr:hypothetical protein [Elusimicrobiota bacterium]